MQESHLETSGSMKHGKKLLFAVSGPLVRNGSVLSCFIFETYLSMPVQNKQTAGIEGNRRNLDDASWNSDGWDAFALFCQTFAKKELLLSLITVALQRGHCHELRIKYLPDSCEISLDFQVLKILSGCCGLLGKCLKNELISGQSTKISALKPSLYLISKTMKCNFFLRLHVIFIK